jgi:hypothetical protein
MAFQTKGEAAGKGSASNVENSPTLWKAHFRVRANWPANGSNRTDCPAPPNRAAEAREKRGAVENRPQPEVEIGPKTLIHRRCVPRETQPAGSQGSFHVEHDALMPLFSKKNSDRSESGDDFSLHQKGGNLF